MNTSTRLSASSDEQPPSGYDEKDLLDLWKDIKTDCFAQRSVWERQWMRNVYYVLGRQWIEYISSGGKWKDKRMAIWIPRPVTNKCKETLQAIRAMFTSIKLGVNVRPNGNSSENVSTAATADALAPIIHEDHDMNSVLTEFDFWLIATGNAFLHTFLDYDIKYGHTIITAESCTTCQTVTPSDQLVGAQPVCPSCKGTSFEQATDPKTGEPIQQLVPKGKPVTIPLSPLEVAFPNGYSRFADVPYLVRLRWRTKRYFEQHPTLKLLVPTLSWQKSPQDQSLSLFRSLASHNDLGIGPGSHLEDIAAGDDQEGIPEYEIWVKPCTSYPTGCVFRVVGDSDPTVLDLKETEGIPGPLPYTDADGRPLFTFTHAGYEQVGGRLLASGPIDAIIQKQDQLNQLDSHILLTFTRMANPVWLEPKGAEIEKLTGMPGLVIKWNPLTVGGNAKPERIPGMEVSLSAFKLREQYLRDIEELAGTFDIIKGAKPTGIEAFSALQLLVERGQARFAGVFQSRGDAYRNWFKFALELEREFGPDERTKPILNPTTRSWSFETFKRAQLQGSVSIVVEDGSNAPKTSLGMRAAVEHANQLGMLDMRDPDQKYEGLKLFGLTRLVPALDVHVQAALQKQQEFEDWVKDPRAMQNAALLAQQDVLQYEQGLSSITPEEAIPPPPSAIAHTPLAWKKWYDPIVHRQECLKWANTDRVRELIQSIPQAGALIEAHLTEMESLLAEQQMASLQAAQLPPHTSPGGAGMAMANANREAGKSNEPRGHRQGAQRQGPA